MSGSLPDLISLRLGVPGPGQPVPPAKPEEPSEGYHWLHLRRDAAETADILAALQLAPEVKIALTAEETRPRSAVYGDGVLLILRGVNLNPGAEPEDMVSVRLWLTERRVVGVWVRQLVAVQDLLAAAERGAGPGSPGDFAAKLALRLADRAEPSVAALNEDIDALEEAALDPESPSIRARLSAVRRSAIMLRRYMQPQKDALTTLEIEDMTWLTETDRLRIREAADRVSRLGEDLDAIRDRAQVVQDQLMDIRSDMMNRRMLLLAVISVIFLPLGLVTGILGVNVGGMPGADNPYAFWVMMAGLAAGGAALYAWLKKSGMIP